MARRVVEGEEGEEIHHNPFLSDATAKPSSRLQFRNEISRACWDESSGMGEVLEKKGSMWATTGVVRNGRLYCHIEEILFLAERGAVVISGFEDPTVNVKDIYKKIAEGNNWCSWEAFEAYRHLKVLGYIVGRHGVPWTMKSNASHCSVNSCDNSPVGERKLKCSIEEDCIIQHFRDMQINETSPTFDVYLPNSKFRKSCPGNPSFLLCLLRDKPPLRLEVENLERTCGGIPLKFCFVDHGRTCLSWEFLRWQYEKARELPESDPYRSHQYNQVAGEFQQLQVMMQRFLENESFQGPRLANYVKNRCVLRNLLQVPVIKEDCLKDKMEERRKGNNAITSEILEDIMEESIGIFWEFVKADKDETPEILKGLIVNQVELQDPSDSSLLVGAHKILQKKEKRLKDLLRTGNCLVKRFKKPQEDRSNQDLFFSQVDLKLVARVLKMSRLSSDQLGWCHKKLGNIIFLDRKLHREPSFLLFPC